MPNLYKLRADDNESKYWRFIERDREYHQLGSEFADNCIKSFDGEVIKDEGLYPEDDFNYIAQFVGTVFNIMPSGKYYTPYANSNVSWLEAAKDHCFTSGLDSTLDDNDYWIQSGEGDPCDLFVCKAL